MADGPTSALLERIGRDLATLDAADTIDNRRAALRLLAELYGPEPAPVGRIEQREVPSPDGGIGLRIYYPATAVTTSPLLLHLHGGGWALGDFATYERVCRAYCRAANAIVVDVEYRRAPEHKYPAAYRDCEVALDWLAAHAADLGGDPARIVVTGDSAGGNLAASLCLHTRVPVWKQVLVYPVLSASASASFQSRAEFGDGRFFLSEAAIKRAETEYLSSTDDGEETRASPLLATTASLSRLPPSYIIAAGLDPLRDEAAAYAKRLRRARVEVKEVVVEGTIHAFVLFAGAIPAGQAAIESIGAWIRAD